MPTKGHTFQDRITRIRERTEHYSKEWRLSSLWWRFYEEPDRGKESGTGNKGDVGLNLDCTHGTLKLNIERTRTGWEMAARVWGRSASVTYWDMDCLYFYHTYRFFIIFFLRLYSPWKPIILHTNSVKFSCTASIRSLTYTSQGLITNQPNNIRAPFQRSEIIIIKKIKRKKKTKKEKKKKKIPILP